MDRLGGRFLSLPLLRDLPRNEDRGWHGPVKWGWASGPGARMAGVELVWISRAPLGVCLQDFEDAQNGRRAMRMPSPLALVAWSKVTVIS